MAAKGWVNKNLISLEPKVRPGNNSGLSGILGFGSEIFCENAVVATQEIVISTQG